MKDENLLKGIVTGIEKYGIFVKIDEERSGWL